jgi:hypothetical protein
VVGVTEDPGAAIVAFLDENAAAVVAIARAVGSNRGGHSRSPLFRGPWGLRMGPRLDPVLSGGSLLDPSLHPMPPCRSRKPGTAPRAGSGRGPEPRLHSSSPDWRHTSSRAVSIGSRCTRIPSVAVQHRWRASHARVLRRSVSTAHDRSPLVRGAPRTLPGRDRVPARENGHSTSGPVDGVGEVTVRIAPTLLTTSILALSAAASDLGGACIPSGMRYRDGSQDSWCTVSESLEWRCNGDPVPRGSILESTLTSSCWPCAERFTTPELPCRERERSIEYCLKPGCLQMIAPP